MARQPQGANAIRIHALPGEIWEILEDSTRLTQWATFVKHTTGKREILGAVRECDVEFDGKPGRTVERCVDHDYPRKIGWLMVEDSFGFSRMMADLGFDFVLERVSPEETRVLLTTYYRPKGLTGRLMSTLMMRPKFHKMRERVLANLKRLAEDTPARSGLREGNNETLTPQRDAPASAAGRN